MASNSLKKKKKLKPLSDLGKYVTILYYHADPFGVCQQFKQLKSAEGTRRYMMFPVVNRIGKKRFLRHSHPSSYVLIGPPVKFLSERYDIQVFAISRWTVGNH